MFRLSNPKQFARNFFAFFGLRISRMSSGRPTGSNKYFNTGRLSPLQENSCELYERFYADHEALKEYYQGYRLEFYEAVCAQIRSHGVVIDGKDVLDVGCGSGHLITEICKWSQPSSVSGCDFAEEAINFSRESFSNVNFFRHDIYDPLPQKQDVILCTEVLEHLERPFVALKNLTEALKPNGTIILTVPNGRFDTLNEHLNFWSPESWKVFLKRECPKSQIITALIMNDRVNFGLLRYSAS